MSRAGYAVGWSCPTTRPLTPSSSRSAARRGRTRHWPLAPYWLTAYSSAEVPKCPCLFGLPQTTTAPAAQPVALAESAKTAMLCTYHLPTYTWLAMMGKSYLMAERLASVKRRQLLLLAGAGAHPSLQPLPALLLGG